MPANTDRQDTHDSDTIVYTTKRFRLNNLL
jgi:hypothetical protein